MRQKCQTNKPSTFPIEDDEAEPGICLSNTETVFTISDMISI